MIVFRVQCRHRVRHEGPHCYAKRKATDPWVPENERCGWALSVPLAGVLVPVHAVRRARDALMRHAVRGAGFEYSGGDP